MPYLNWDTKKVTDFTGSNIESLYEAGYVFTRVEKGVMNKTRSFRVNIDAYIPSSENRRILRKAEHLTLATEKIPYEAYNWRIGKLAKDFYEKFGSVVTANKIKEMLTDPEKSNFNTLLTYTDTKTNTIIGYVICFETDHIIHYCYPFYLENPAEPSRGLGMMTMALEWARTNGKQYVYLGSLQRPTDSYKMQFLGGEWFDSIRWQVDTEPLKKILV